MNTLQNYISGQKLVSLALLLAGGAMLVWQWQAGRLPFTAVRSALEIVLPSNEVNLADVAQIPLYVGEVKSATATDSPALTPADFLGGNSKAVGYESSLVAQKRVAASLSAPVAIVIDIPSASVLFEKNADQKMYPASTVKLMTALVSREIYGLQDELTILDEVYVEGNTIGLRKNEVMTVENLLKALLIESGNDAARVLSYSHPRGHDAYIERMNQKAQELGLTATSFVNATGLDAEEQQTSARDLAIIVRAVAQDPVLKSIVGTKTETIFDARAQFQHDLVSTNILLGSIPGVIGAKTGTTPWAAQALVTLFELGDRQLAIVVLGSQDRFTDTTFLIDWVQKNYQWYLPDSPQLQDLLH